MPAILLVSSHIDRGSAYCFGACSLSLTICLLSKLISSFTRVLLFFLRLASGEKSILITKQLSETFILSISMSLCSTSSSFADALLMKLLWNLPVDAEKIYFAIREELKTKLIFESVDYVCNEEDSSYAIISLPGPILNAISNADSRR